MFKRVITALVCLIPLNFIKIPLLNLIGHKVSLSSSIGFSLVLCKKICLKKQASIGSFNFIKCEKLILKEKSCIKKLNYLKGNFEVFLNEKAIMSNLNKISGSQNYISTLVLGKNSIIVTGNLIDLTRSVFIGENSILAGKGSQLWTHGFYHADKGPERIRIDGSITIGDNVYVGSRCTFNPGVSVGNSIHIGAGTIISKNLDKPGMYVGQGLRHIENSLDKIKSKLEFSHKHPLGNDIYIKD